MESGSLSNTLRGGASALSPGLEYKRSNFSPAFIFLSRDQREALRAVYSFCREVDDIVDQNNHVGGFSASVLESWRHFLCGEGPAPRPEMGARLEHAMKRYDIPKAHFLEILEGVKIDIQRSRYETFEALKTYCYGVASAVGLCCLPIFGVPIHEARDYAIHSGMAFQLTNIIRDVATDADRGRIYLPLEDLERFGYGEKDLLSKTYDSRFVALLKFQAGRAKDFYRLAGQSIPPVWYRQLLPARIMTGVYRGILDKIEKNDFRVFEGKVQLSTFSKWVVVVRVLSS